jgi:phospho-N-acetylmuramoyl-pentapeptide-transferase
VGRVSEQVWVFIISFFIALAAGFILIPALRRLKASQTVRDDGPSTHLKKTGTPTLGGLIILLPVILTSIKYMPAYRHIIFLLLSAIGFGLIGFADDMIKIVKRRKDGLMPRQKTFLLIFVSAALSIYAAYYSPLGTKVFIPFTGMERAITIPPVLYIPFLIFVMNATVNSVNLTDGVDGLAGSVTLVVLVFFTVVSAATEGMDFVKVFSSAAAGGCLGFLAFNIHPAKVFMGDTGSFALGGALASIAILLGIPWILAIAGIVYVVEALSDIIQVAHFKATGKRVFKMAPIHHHFELSGWKENKVVVVFTAVTLLFCILGMISLGMSPF